MAIETVTFLISPNDGWTLVATNPDYLLIRPEVKFPWRLAVTASGAPVAPAQATATITFTGPTTNGETIVINGTTFTFVSTTPSGPSEVAIGATAGDTRDNLLTNIPLVITPGLTINAAASGGAAIALTAVVPGTAGNAFTLTDTSSDITLSGATFSGGTVGTGSVVFKSEDDGSRDYYFESLAPMTGLFYVKADNPMALQGGNVKFGVVRDEGPGSTGGGSSPSRVLVEPLGQPSTARQLAAGAASANTALTATVRRVSMRALTADIRYSIGTTSQTATAASHFIAQNERLDVAVPLGANIAVIRNASTDGTLELSELI